LYAPKPGKEMREELKTKGSEYFEKSKEGWEVALEKAKEGIEIGKAKIEELAGKIKESTTKIIFYIKHIKHFSKYHIYLSV
ncbi:unnamed protein product, partial [marine sediment metagenome]